MCRFNGDPSPVIELDQQEQEVGSWKILPLAPPRVSVMFLYYVVLSVHNYYYQNRSQKLLSRTTKLVEESLTVDLS